MKKIMIAGWETAEDTYQNYIIALEQLGGEAFVSLDIEDLDKADGLILPGSSQDMNPQLWGEEDIHSNDINDWLDRRQWLLMDKAVACGKPILGICRGMQFINVYFGGTLIQQLPSAEKHESADPERYHTLFTHEGTTLHCLYGMGTETNTRHHQGIGLVGAKLKVSATWIDDSDLVIEALEHEQLPIMGVQWHPERMMLFGNPTQKEDGRKLLWHWFAR